MFLFFLFYWCLTKPFYSQNFRVIDDAKFLQTATELSEYGIRLNVEDAAFTSKLTNIARRHTSYSFIQYFELLSSLEDEAEIVKHIDTLNAACSALKYRLRTKNQAAIDFRNEMNELHPLVVKVEKEKKKENRITLTDDSSTLS